MQEQPPGYNMVRVDVANMEQQQQAQEVEGAQARFVIAESPSKNFKHIMQAPGCGGLRLRGWRTFGEARGCYN